MRYATWKIDFSDDANQGTGPESFVTVGKIEGGFEKAPFEIVGYVSDDAVITGLEKWEVTEITQEEALNYCLALNSESFIDSNGRISTSHNLTIS